MSRPPVRATTPPCRTPPPRPDRPQAEWKAGEEARDDGQARRLYRRVYDAPATGTERRTDAKFLEPARHGVRHDTVEPDDCEHQRKHREGQQQQRHEPLTGPT